MDAMGDVFAAGAGGPGGRGGGGLHSAGEAWCWASPDPGDASSATSVGQGESTSAGPAWLLARGRGSPMRLGRQSQTCPHCRSLALSWIRAGLYHRAYHVVLRPPRRRHLSTATPEKPICDCLLPVAGGRPRDIPSKSRAGPSLSCSDSTETLFRRCHSQNERPPLILTSLLQCHIAPVISQLVGRFGCSISAFGSTEMAPAGSTLKPTVLTLETISRYGNCSSPTKTASFFMRFPQRCRMVGR